MSERRIAIPFRGDDRHCATCPCFGSSGFLRPETPRCRAFGVDLRIDSTTGRPLRCAECLAAEVPEDARPAAPNPRRFCRHWDGVAWQRRDTCPTAMHCPWPADVNCETDDGTDHPSWADACNATPGGAGTKETT
jgi:hypothetical protein